MVLSISCSCCTCRYTYSSIIMFQCRISIGLNAFLSDDKTSVMRGKNLVLLVPKLILLWIALDAK